MDNEDQKIILLFGNDSNCNPQDELGRTPLHDFAMTQGKSLEADAEFASGVKSVKKVFIKNSLSADPKLAKPSSLAPDLSSYGDECARELQLKTNSQISTSSSSAAFFQTSTSANSATYVKDNVQTKPRFN